MSLIVKRDRMSANSSHTKHCSLRYVHVHIVLICFSVLSQKDVQHNRSLLQSPVSRKTLLPHRSWETGLVLFPIAPCMDVDTADKQINKPKYGIQYEFFECRGETHKHSHASTRNALLLFASWRDVLCVDGRTKQTNMTSCLKYWKMKTLVEILAPKIYQTTNYSVLHNTTDRQLQWKQITPYVWLNVNIKPGPLLKCQRSKRGFKLIAYCENRIIMII